MISNVPGAREPLYWRGARLDGNYPLSIALDGQAVNITLANNGPNAAPNVVLTDLLPAGSTFVSMTPAGTNHCTPGQPVSMPRTH